MTDRWCQLFEIADSYITRYPDGHEPFQILARLTEELGEVATEVNHLERTGAKVHKRGEPDRAALGYELEDLIHTAVELARFYGVEKDLDQAIQETHARAVGWDARGG